MLKRTTASFFTAFLELGGPKAQVQSASQSDPKVPDVRDRATELVSSMGPHIAACLVNQIGGLAQRSELEALSKVLRSLITTQPATRRWLEGALSSETFVAAARVGEADRRVFVQKIIMLRGGRQTTAVVRDFWAACKGTVSSF